MLERHLLCRKCPEGRGPSRPAAGTNFKIFFPVVRQEMEAGAGKSVARQAPGGNETILLVEDEDGVRSLVVAVLQSKGYNLMEASTADQALRLSAQHAGKIDLLLTDVILPQMTGRELSERLQATRPGTKILFMSGYTDDKLSTQGGFSHKIPFTIGRCGLAVRPVSGFSGGSSGSSRAHAASVRSCRVTITCSILSHAEFANTP